MQCSCRLAFHGALRIFRAAQNNAPNPTVSTHRVAGATSSFQPGHPAKVQAGGRTVPGPIVGRPAGPGPCVGGVVPLPLPLPFEPVPVVNIPAQSSKSASATAIKPAGVSTSNGNVFCLPAELEAFGLVFVEAMTAGTPVVACYSGGVPEVVIQNLTGLLSPPGDVPALAANLIRVLSDTVYARGLGEAGQRRAAAEFGPEKVAQRWMSVLQEMVGPVNKVRL